MRHGADVRLDTLNGGLVLRDSAELLGSKDASFVNDYMPDGSGLEQRPGDSALDTDTLGNQMPTPLMPTSDRLLVLTEGGRLYNLDPLFGVITFIAVLPGAPPPTAFAQAVPSTVKMTASGGQGPYWIATNGNSYYTDGAAVGAWTAATGALPIGPHMISAANRLWRSVVTTASDPASALGWSGINAARDWPAANVTMFGPGDGENILRVARIGDGILVAKPSRAWFIYDLDTSANREIGMSAGFATGANLACETPMGLVSVDPFRGLIATDGSSVKVLDDTLQPLFEHLGNMSMLTRGRLFYWRDSLWLIAGLSMQVPADATSTYGRFLYQYDLRTKSWWRHRVANLADCTPMSLGPGLQFLYGLEGVVNNWRLTRLMDGQTVNRGDGVPIVPVWQSGLLDLGERARKRITSTFVDAEGAAVTATVYSDVTRTIVAGEGPVNTPSGVLAQDTDVPPVRLPGAAPSLRAAVRIEGARKLHEVTLRVAPRGRR